MAKEVIAYSLEVDGSKAGKSLSDLKKEFKEGQAELSKLTKGSKEYVQQLEKLGRVKDDISDLNTEIKAFNPEGKVQAFGKVVSGLAGGFSAAQGAVALFSNGNKDLEKTLVKVQAAMAFSQGIQGLVGLGDAFKVVGNIIKANPIFLIVSIVAAIGTALFALKDKIGIVGDAFDFLGKIIGTVVQSIKDFTDWIGISSFAMDEYSEKTVNNLKKVGDSLVDKYDKEIKLAQAAGKNTEELEKKKQEAIIKTARLEAMILIETAKARGEFTDEENKRISELIKKVSDASFEVQLINVKEKKAIEDSNKKLSEKNKQELDKRVEDQRTHAREIEKIWQESIYNRQQQEINSSYQTAEQKQIILDAELNAQNEAFSGAAEFQSTVKVENMERFNALDREGAANSLAISQATNDGLQSLSDLFFMVKSRNLQKGSAEELRAAKQQFKINKALAITTATIQGVQAVLAAYSSGSAIPVVGAVTGPLFAALAGVTVAANIAKISNAKFNESGSGGGSVGAIPSPSAPSISPPTQGSTQLNSDGTVKNTQQQQPVIKAVVVETDITSKQKNIVSIQEKSKL